MAAKEHPSLDKLSDEIIKRFELSFKEGQTSLTEEQIAELIHKAQDLL